MKYFKKEATKRRKKKSWKSEGLKGFALGAVSGLAHAAVTHPIEHKLYGKATGMNWGKHLMFRGGKAALATSATLGTYHFLNTLSNRRKKKFNKHSQNVGL